MTDNPFRRLWSLGYTRLCPITPPGCPLSERSSFHKRLQHGDDARGKAPGVRWPDGNWSGFSFVDHESAEADLDRWNGMGAGVGVKTGRGLVLIDADTLNPQHAALIEAEIEQRFGKLPLRIGQAPKAGYVIRTDEDFQYARVEFGERDEKGRLRDRVEILSEGRQFVALGIHPKTGKPYEWPRGLPAVSDIPKVDGSALTALLEALSGILPAASAIVQEGSGKDVDQRTLLGDMALVRKAVEATPNSSSAFPSRESWVGYGYAIKAAAGAENEREALELFLDWSARWQEGENDAEIAEAEWRRMKPPFKRGASWLYEIAEQQGAPGSFNRAEQWFEPVKNEAPLFPEIGLNAFEPKKTFTFEPFYEAADSALTDTAEPLIEGLLDAGAMSVVYGQSNVGKTFVSMDIAYHVARGLPYAGMWTAQGNVIYLSAEGGNSIKKRNAALCAKYGRSSAVPLLLLRSTIDLRRPDADLKPLIAAIGGLGVPISLIVVDTLARAMAGGDENSSVDMGMIVSSFDKLREHTKAHLMVVHHSGKNQAAGARGHSSLRASTDTEIEIGDGLIDVKKQRDLDGSWSRNFDLDVHTLGVNKRGTPVTSCTVRLHDGRGVARIAGATETESRILRAMGELEAFNPSDNAGVSVTEIVDFFANDTDNMSENSVRMALKKVVQKGLATKCQRGRWRPVRTTLDHFLDQNIFE